jgi:hypothetical protein
MKKSCPNKVIHTPDLNCFKTEALIESNLLASPYIFRLLKLRNSSGTQNRSEITTKTKKRKVVSRQVGAETRLSFRRNKQAAAASPPKQLLKT